MPASQSFTEMRRRNASELVNMVRKSPGISRAELSKRTGLSKAAVSDIVDELLYKFVLLESGDLSSTGGRPAIGLRFNSESRYVLGCSIEDYEMSFCIMNLDGEVQHERVQVLQPSWKAIDVSSVLHSFIQSALEKFDLSIDRICSTCFAIPGPLIRKDGEVDLSRMGEFGELVALMENALGSPIKVESNTFAAAKAEANFYEIGDEELVLVVRIGHNVRSVLIRGASFIRGARGSAGEFGHLSVPGGEKLCSCGSIGCVNTLASVPEILNSCREYGLSVKNVDELAYLAKIGDMSATKIINEAVQALLAGLHSVIELLAPHSIILCGPESIVEETMEAASESELIRSSCLKNNCLLVNGKVGHKPESFGSGLIALGLVPVVPRA